MDTQATYYNPFRCRRILIILLMSVAVMRVVLTFFHEANWDEYLNLSMVYDYQRGELREVLQTGFVHLFRWVPFVSQNEADQIIAARLVYLGVGLITSLAIWDITRKLTSENAAYFAVLSYWCLGFTLVHGVSLRTDPLAACAMMCALWIVICRPISMRVALIGGALVGLAGIFTIKAIFYVPALILVALIRSPSMLNGMLLILIAGITAGTSFIGLAALHAATFPNIASPFSFLDRTMGSTMNTQNFSILIRYFSQVFARDILYVFVTGVGLFTALSQLTKPTKRPASLIALALLTPLLSVLIYRDVYPYYYPFILAPVALLAGFTWQLFLRRYDPRIVLLVAAALCLNAAVITAQKLQFPMSAQRAILEVIHTTFPENSTYIDGRSMVSSMRKRGVFMSTWGMSDYRRSGQLIMEDIIRTHQPKFLLANTPHISLDILTPELSEKSPVGLLKDDFHALQSNYVKYWGPVYVPGKTIQASDMKMKILLPGTYRLTAGGPLTVDGKDILLGETVYLDARTHSIKSSSTTTLMINAPVPEKAPPERSVFSGF